MRNPYSSPNYEDPVEWLTPPEYFHAPLPAGTHIAPIAVVTTIVTVIVDAGANAQAIRVVVRSGDA